MRQVALAAESVPGVHNCHAVRIRTSGPLTFIDVHVEVDGSQSLAEAHALTEAVEQSIQKVLPGSDVTVHPEPLAGTVPPQNGVSPSPALVNILIL